MKILKYPVTHGITNIPKGSIVIHVGLQSDSLFAWCLVPEEINGQYEAIYAFHTGEECYEDAHLHKGTFLLNGGTYVLHVFVVPEIYSYT